MTSEEKLEVVKLLTEDIQSHRDYVQRLYRNAVLIGGSVLLLIAVLGTWLLGERYDESLLRTVVNNELRAEVDRLREEQTQILENELAESTSAATAGAQTDIISAAEKVKNDVIAELNEFAERQLFEAVRQNIEPQIDELQLATAAELAGAVALPAGLVAAFDLPNGCPLGWSHFDASAGRVIIGVDGERYRLSYEAGEPKYVTGGAETHTLTIEEMPAHSHRESGGRFSNRSGSGRGDVQDPGSSGRNIRTDSVGGGKPHNNMPPYIALYYCKKD